jgi:hypothetical protein
MTIGMRDYTSTPENFQVISSSWILDLRIWSRLLELTGFGLHREERCKSFGVCCEEHTFRVLCGLQQLMKFYIWKITLLEWWMQTLANCQKEVCKELDIPEHECELSMGMSGDFELAVLFFISISLLLSTSSGLIYHSLSFPYCNGTCSSDIFYRFLLHRYWIQILFVFKKCEVQDAHLQWLYVYPCFACRLKWEALMWGLDPPSLVPGNTVQRNSASSLPVFLEMDFHQALTSSLWLCSSGKIGVLIIHTSVGCIIVVLS